MPPPAPSVVLAMPPATDLVGARANATLLGLLGTLLAATAAVHLLALDYAPPRTTGRDLDRLVAWRRSRGRLRPENWSDHLTP